MGEAAGKEEKACSGAVEQAHVSQEGLLSYCRAGPCEPPCSEQTAAAARGSAHSAARDGRAAQERERENLRMPHRGLVLC